MSKINWVFQDEQGSNLNRYKATNVATGEQITFDLLRGGSISVVGTPLNAEKLNSLITAINDNYDKLTALQSQHSTDVTNLQKAINTNASNISANTTNIANLVTSMGSKVTYKTGNLNFIYTGQSDLINVPSGGMIACYPSVVASSPNLDMSKILVAFIIPNDYFRGGVAYLNGENDYKFVVFGRILKAFPTTGGVNCSVLAIEKV